MNLEPRKPYQKDRNVADQHTKMVDSALFHASAQAALLHLILSAPEAKTLEEAAGRWRQVEGARALLIALMNLAEVHKAPPAAPHQNLPNNR